MFVSIAARGAVDEGSVRVRGAGAQCARPCRLLRFVAASAAAAVVVLLLVFLVLLGR